MGPKELRAAILAARIEHARQVGRNLYLAQESERIRQEMRGGAAAEAAALSRLTRLVEQAVERGVSFDVAEG